MEILSQPLVKYDWDAWTDGQTRRAVKGVDYLCTTAGFKAAVSNHARRHGLRAITRIQGESVVFRFFRRGEGDEQQPDA